MVATCRHLENGNRCELNAETSLCYLVLEGRQKVFCGAHAEEYGGLVKRSVWRKAMLENASNRVAN